MKPLRAGLAPVAPRPRRGRHPHPVRRAGAGGGRGDRRRLRHRPRRARAGAWRPTACSAATRWCAATRRSPARCATAANAAGLRSTETHRTQQHDPRRAAMRSCSSATCARWATGFPLRGSFRIVDAHGGPERDARRHARARHGVDEPRRRATRSARRSATRSRIGDAQLAPRRAGGAGTRRGARLLQRRAARCSSTSPTCPRPGWCRKAAASATGWSSPASARRSSASSRTARASARRAASAWKRSSDARPGDALRARSRRPLPRPGRAGVGGAGRGRGGDGRAPPQRAPSVRHRGDALPRREPAHAGRHPRRRTAAARADREHGGRRARVRAAVGGRRLAGAARWSLSIPPAGWLPALQGYGVGLVVLLAFGAPPVLALRRVPALRVLRRDLDPTEPSAWLVAHRRPRRAWPRCCGGRPVRPTLGHRDARRHRRHAGGAGACWRGC